MQLLRLAVCPLAQNCKVAFCLLQDTIAAFQLFKHSLAVRLEVIVSGFEKLELFNQLRVNIVCWKLKIAWRLEQQLQRIDNNDTSATLTRLFVTVCLGSLNL